MKDLLQLFYRYKITGSKVSVRKIFVKGTKRFLFLRNKPFTAFKPDMGECFYDLETGKHIPIMGVFREYQRDLANQIKILEAKQDNPYV